MALMTANDPSKLPALKRPREEREPLVAPTRLRLALVVSIGLTLIAVLLAAYGFSATTNVPTLTGRSEQAARAIARSSRLQLVVSERLFSTRAKGTVLSQSPAPGRRVVAGRTVHVSVSGGTGQVLLPDLTGLASAQAQERLKSLGLLYRIVEEASPKPAGTVISTVPPAGSRLRVGDTVVVHVARTTDVIELVSYDLSERTIVIEPRYQPNAPGVDHTYDVAQRLSALVKAAGGKAVITRASTETTLPAAVFAERATAAHPSAQLIIRIESDGASGMAVKAPDPNSTLAQALLAQLRWVAPQARSSATTLVSAAPPASSAVISLGRSDSRSDRALFSDSLFRDNLARALYLGLGKTLGR
ncbi:MAG: PASTA domain-containing protein [Actinomycetia bacterium]|nr:PASTA domain-containing protein [Actinomycetes bacterium]